jgi:hypothetical protein
LEAAEVKFEAGFELSDLENPLVDLSIVQKQLILRTASRLKNLKVPLFSPSGPIEAKITPMDSP